MASLVGGDVGVTDEDHLSTSSCPSATFSSRLAIRFNLRDLVEDVVRDTNRINVLLNLTSTLRDLKWFVAVGVCLSFRVFRANANCHFGANLWDLFILLTFSILLLLRIVFILGLLIVTWCELRRRSLSKNLLLVKHSVAKFFIEKFIGHDLADTFPQDWEL